MPMTFVIRLSVDETGRITGIVERVKTGEKERVYGFDAISATIARMVGESQHRDSAEEDAR